MDAEITLLAGTAGTTIATLLATDTWNGVRNGVITLWRRVRPDHEDQIAAQLDTSRRDLLGARSSGDEETGREIAAEWQGRIRRRVRLGSWEVLICTFADAGCGRSGLLLP
ncbi:hypothetical protein [Streptomyces sp. NPDC088727]|uniref:hypothetical protein n=1 Tax=Streptomyces sp. NPDC088727 TaxID=3365875 RepID=UPI00382736EC